MEKNEKEILKKLKNIREIAQEDLEANNFENYEVKDVIHYNEKVKLVKKENNKKEKFDLYVVITENQKTEKEEEPIFEIEYLEDKNGKVYTIADLIHEYDPRSFENIKDVVDKSKENEQLQEEEQDEEFRTESLNELEEKEKEEKEEKDKKIETSERKEQDEKIEDLKISNVRGEVNLDQQVNGETLRKILGLGEEYRSIAPVKTSTVGVKGSSKYCFVAIKNDKTCTVLEEDILEPDKQEGMNPYDKDTKINRDGTISQDSSIAGFKIANRPNLYLSVGFDENSSTRETTITDVSGRNSRENEMSYELEKKGDSWQEADARNSLRREQGIGKADEMSKKQKEHAEQGCENERIENIDLDKQNDEHIHLIDPNEKIPDTDITWQKLANMCGYRGEGGVEKAYKEFKDYEADHKDLQNKEIIDNIVEEIENEVPGPIRERERR